MVGIFSPAMFFVAFKDNLKKYRGYEENLVGNFVLRNFVDRSRNCPLLNWTIFATNRRSHAVLMRGIYLCLAATC